MFFIAHRGNTDGPKPELENKPQYKTDLDFLRDPLIVCHAKNELALSLLVRNNIHCFGHDKDDVVLTSFNWLWTYPGKQLASNSIAVMPEMAENWDISGCMGVCSDYADKCPLAMKPTTYPIPPVFLPPDFQT